MVKVPTCAARMAVVSWPTSILARRTGTALDIVARAIDYEMKRPGGGSHVSGYQPQNRLSSLSSTSRPSMNVARKSVSTSRPNPFPWFRQPTTPVAASAIDHKGKPMFPVCSAIGEVSHTGLHGANRMASNSLLECIGVCPRGGGGHPQPPCRSAANHHRRTGTRARSSTPMKR